MLDANGNEECCLLIADIYEESRFQVICQSELSKEFLLTVGARTGCPLSSALFILSLDRSLKEVHNRAIRRINILDEKRTSQLPVEGLADDVVFVTHSDVLLSDM